MMGKILVVVVLYSRPPQYSDTIVSLSKLKSSYRDLDVQVYIHDNSVVGYKEYDYDLLLGDWSYFHDGNNWALSKIYNKAMTYDFDYAVLLDDDSWVSFDYFNELSRYVKSERNYVAAPRITHSDQLISPGRLIGVRGKAFRDRYVAGMVGSVGLTCMMSGVVIPKSISMNVLFDERLAFYGVDTKFFSDYMRRYEHLYILDVDMAHSSALRSSDGDFGENYWRLKKLMESWPIVFEDKFFSGIRLSLYGALFLIKRVIRERDLRYLSLLKLCGRWAVNV